MWAVLENSFMFCSSDSFEIHFTDVITLGKQPACWFAVLWYYVCMNLCPTPRGRDVKHCLLVVIRTTSIVCLSHAALNSEKKECKSSYKGHWSRSCDLVVVTYCSAARNLLFNNALLTGYYVSLENFHTGLGFVEWSGRGGLWVGSGEGHCSPLP